MPDPTTMAATTAIEGPGPRVCRGVGAVLPVIALLAAGCGGGGLSAVGPSYIIDMGAPPRGDRVIGDWGADVVLASLGRGDARPISPATVGLFVYPDEHGEWPVALFAGYDVALSLCARAGAFEDPDRSLFPVLRPVLGMWWWVESPDNFGLLTGLRAGLGKVVARGGAGKRRAVMLEYARYRLNDVEGDFDVDLETATVSLAWQW